MRWADHYIAELARGGRVTFCPRGRSMEPRIHDGQRVTVAPVGEQQPKPGDVVLCSVRGRQFLHLVKAVDGGGRYQIANNRGHINGWTRRIYGVLVENEKEGD
jgi:hypothetical protein